MKRAITGLALLMAVLSGCNKTNAPSGETPAVTQPAPAKEPQSIVIPAGAHLKIRTTNALSTASAKSGETFSATLQEPLQVGDQVVAPKGARVSGRVVESDPGGRVKGRASIAIQLTEIEASGRNLLISTNTVQHEAKASKTKDAAKIGIGSGIGAAIGAIAGGGKGAGIGAAAGGAAGTGLVLSTHGDPAVIASESVLTFRLEEPLVVQ